MEPTESNDDHVIETLSTSLRHSIEALMARQHDIETLRRSVESAAAIEEALAASPLLPIEQRLRRFGQDMIHEPVEHGEPMESFGRSPVAGRLHPKSVPTSIRRIDDGVEATVRLGVAHEGAPGRAHGGLTAAMFDDLMGVAQRVVGRRGYTRTLTVDYLAPFPIGEEVTFRVTLASVDERTFALSGTAAAEGREIATAMGTFTEVTAERFGMT